MKIAVVICVLVALSVGGCNPFYVIQAGMTQSEILLHRRSIESVVQDPETSPEITRKLALVTDVRDFSQHMALSPKGSFQSYSALDRDTLAWIVLAAKPDSFTFYTWWFPFVGSVPYKGYFTPEAAKCAAQSLNDQGYETLVRGTEAFSTLGWFDDPVMTPMLRNQDAHVAGTVLHEILHTTLWVPNYVAFNESAANFVGNQGAVTYFEARTAQCQSSDAQCKERSRGDAEQARKTAENGYEVSRTLGALIPELTELYRSSESRERKIELREAVFKKHIDPLRQKIPQLKFLKKAHNAELMQLQLYYSKLDLFKQLWDNGSGDWQRFIGELRDIAARSEEENKDPFLILAEVVGKNALAAPPLALP